MKIIEMHPEHWDAVKEIYQQGIATGNATFQTSVPSWEDIYADGNVDAFSAGSKPSGIINSKAIAASNFYCGTYKKCRLKLKRHLWD